MLNAGAKKEGNTSLGAVRTKLLQGNGSSSSSSGRRKLLSGSGLIILVMIVSEKQEKQNIVPISAALKDVHTWNLINTLSVSLLMFLFMYHTCFLDDLFLKVQFVYQEIKYRSRKEIFKAFTEKFCFFRKSCKPHVGKIKSHF
jgi:hypothetical protein